MTSQGPYAVVVSDLRMPGLDGVKFLTEVRRRVPNAVRIMLTGYSNVENAIAAVNEGQIFRFLIGAPMWSAQIAPASASAPISASP